MSAIAAVGIVAAIVLLLIAVPIMLAEHSELPRRATRPPGGRPQATAATPAPAASQTVDPTADQRVQPEHPAHPAQIAYFSEVGFSAGHDDRLIRWDSAVVEVDVRGATSWVERDLVMNVIDELNSILDEPHFTLIRTKTPTSSCASSATSGSSSSTSSAAASSASAVPQWNVRSGEIDKRSS